MAKRTRKAHTASNTVLTCARLHRARPLGRINMRPRFHFGLAAMLAVAALVCATHSFAQSSTPATSTTTPPAASAPASTTTPSQPSAASDRPQFGVPNDNSGQNPAGQDKTIPPVGTTTTGSDAPSTTPGDKGGNNPPSKADTAKATTPKSDDLPSPGEALD